ncbi:MAG: hypothetical protein ACLQM8_01895 [Limisphaerales bacterium]
MSSTVSRALPCVVQVGFAGSRQLFDLPAGSVGQRAEIDRQLEDHLVQTLASLSGSLGLQDHHFLCGISQIAIGADTIFTRACARLKIPQRIFLPQPRDVYFAASSPRGQPDFSAADRLEAEKLLASEHIIQERVVSDAGSRAARFEDCNREILRVSDVLVCMLGADATSRRGGTEELFSLALSHGRKVLEVRVGLTEGRAKVVCEWHGPKGFPVPALPKSIETLSLTPKPEQETGAAALPSVAEFCAAVKEHTSAQAKRHHGLFSRAALVVIATHVLATLCATVALASHGSHDAKAESMIRAAWWICALLVLELILLVAGLKTHLWLHHAKSLKAWAVSRLLVEINRSVTALGDLHIYLAHQFASRVPADLHPLLRTINILHLRSTRPFASKPWESLRDAYLFNRLTDPDPANGQIQYYADRSQAEAKWLRLANTLFFGCSSLAILSTGAKLAVVLGGLRWAPESETVCAKVLGSLTIFLPTLAVGALSWAAAKEYKARVQSFEAMRDFLEMQRDRLQQASSDRQFRRLVEETESRLLGETVDWYFRTTVIAVPS